MSVFEKFWKEGWLNPNLDLDLDIEDINLDELEKKKSIIVEKDERVYRISIPSEKDFDDLDDRDIRIEELPGVAAKSTSRSVPELR